MALKPYYLGDTSALARLEHPEVAERLGPLLESGLVARCTPTNLDLIGEVTGQPTESILPAASVS